MFTTSNSDQGIGGIAAGRALAARRKALYLTQTELALLAGCSLSAITNLEAGMIPRRSKVLERTKTALERLEAEGKGGEPE